MLGSNPFKKAMISMSKYCPKKEKNFSLSIERCLSVLAFVKMWGKPYYVQVLFNVQHCQMIKGVGPSFKASWPWALKCCKSFWKGGKGIDSNSSRSQSSSSLLESCMHSKVLLKLRYTSECYSYYCRSLLDATFVTFYMPRKLAWRGAQNSRRNLQILI